MNKNSTKFTLLFTCFLALVLGLHLLTLNLLELPLFANEIINAYVINYLLTIGIFVALLLLKEKYAASLGYIFFMGSLLKFIVFFLFIYPVYKADGIVTRIEFLTFFIPYANSLVFEVTYLVKTLNKEG